MPTPGGSGHSEVVVFAPSPLLEVVLEAEPELQVHLHAGGQGFWIARMVDSLGAPVRLCATFGGETGFVVRSLIERGPIALRGVETGGWNGCLLEDRSSGERRELSRTPPSPLNRHEVDDLFGVTLVEGIDAGLAVLGGPDGNDDLLEPAVYERLTRDLSANGCRVVADLSGEAMERALEGGLSLLKVSSEELTEMHVVKKDSVEEVAAAVEELATRGAEDVVVTRAEAGVVARLSGRVLEFLPPPLDAVDPRGAGDSLTGGIVAGLAAGMDAVDAVRLGVAAGALNATRHGLASGTRQEIERLTERVEVRDL